MLQKYTKIFYFCIFNYENLIKGDEFVHFCFQPHTERGLLKDQSSDSATPRNAMMLYHNNLRLEQGQLTIINRKFLPLVAEMSGNFCNFAS